MTSDVKRFDLKHDMHGYCGHCDVDMVEHVEGDYVVYDDYYKLLQESKRMGNLLRDVNQSRWGDPRALDNALDAVRDFLIPPPVGVREE